MAVIAMTREMGSLGKDVALGLADKLGLDLIQHEIIEHVADRMHLGESAVNRFLEGRAGLLERWGVDERGLSLYTTEEVVNLAVKGNVLIRGWGATYVLGPVSHVVCVRVCAPLQFRAANLMQRIGVDDERLARKEIEKNDAAHGRTMRQLFDVDWRNPLLYDLVLNTAKIPVDDCVATLAELTRRPAIQETEQSRARLADLQLEAKIRTALKDDPRTQDAGQFFDIVLEHTTGKVKLVGVVHSEAFKEEVEEIAAGVDGVTEIDNQLTVAVLTSV